MIIIIILVVVIGILIFRRTPCRFCRVKYLLICLILRSSLGPKVTPKRLHTFCKIVANTFCRNCWTTIVFITLFAPKTVPKWSMFGNGFLPQNLVEFGTKIRSQSDRIWDQNLVMLDQNLLPSQTGFHQNVFNVDRQGGRCWDSASAWRSADERFIRCRLNCRTQEQHTVANKQQPQIKGVHRCWRSL